VLDGAINPHEGGTAWLKTTSTASHAARRCFARAVGGRPPAFPHRSHDVRNIPSIIILQGGWVSTVKGFDKTDHMGYDWELTHGTDQHNSVSTSSFSIPSFTSTFYFVYGPIDPPIFVFRSEIGPIDGQGPSLTTDGHLKPASPSFVVLSLPVV